MKTSLKQPLFLLLIAALVLATRMGALADTIVADGSDLGATTAGASGPGSEGYLFFGATADLGSTTYGGPSLSSPFSYATWAQGSAYTFTTDGESDLTIDGVDSQTGVDVGSGSGTTQTFGTLTLTGDVPSSFVVGILIDNYNNLYNTTPVTLTLTDDATPVVLESDRTTSDSSVAVTPSNDFYYALITGATAGDTITVEGTNSNGNPFVGGITLDAATVPEPSTWAMLIGGLVALVWLARRRA